jgi:hypothetical protein
MAVPLVQGTGRRVTVVPPVPTTASGTPRARISVTARSSSRLAMPARWCAGATATQASSDRHASPPPRPRRPPVRVHEPVRPRTHDLLEVGEHRRPRVEGERDDGVDVGQRPEGDVHPGDDTTDR